MMKTIILALLVTSTAFAQEYKFLNEIVETKTYLRADYEALQTKYLSVEFFKSNWPSLSLEGVPDIELFLKNFNFTHTKAEIHLNIKSIDFEQLNDKYIRVDNVKEHLEYKSSYTVISKPIFNCFKTWVIIYRSNIYNNDIGSTGDFFIYRKINDKWILYHKVNLWIS